MALVPVYEEVTICNEGMPLPGSVYGEVSEKYGLDGKDNIKIKNILDCDVNCSTGEVLQAVRESKAHREFPWVQDLGTINSKNVIFVEVMKVYEKKASNVEFLGKPVVTSLISKCEGKMVLIFSQPVDAQKIPDLQCILKDALVKDVKPYIPGDFGTNFELANLDTNFEFANLYLDLAKPRTRMTSLKVSLEEFCSYINDIVDKYVTKAIVLKGYNAMDGSETMKMSEQTEKIRPHTNPMEHAAKDTKYFLDQKHQADLHGNLSSTRGKDMIGSVSHLMNHPEVQDKALNSGSQGNDQKDAKTLLNQHLSSDVYGMREFHREKNLTREFVSHENYSTLESTRMKDPSGDVVQFCSDSDIRNIYPLLDKIEEPVNTACDSHYSDCLQDTNTLTFQNESTLTSHKCSFSDGEHLFTEHSHTEPKTRYTEFHSMKAVACDEDCSGLRRKYFGFKSTSKEEKVIILIGNEGSGKTTLINFAANILKGIETADEKLFLVTMSQISEKSPSYSMTAYTFCFAKNDVPITIIDTPGLKDIRGTEENNTLQALKTFFTSDCSNKQLHAIGYVISSNAVCLTSSECHMIDFLLQHYGEGISTNFITFVTFLAETRKTYPVSDIFKSYGIKSKALLKFNNTAFSVKEIDEFDRAYWNLGIKSWKKCIKVLKELPPLAIKTLRVKQKQIYSTYLVKSVEDKLKNELKSFILSFKETNGLTQPIQEKSEQVWQSTMALYHLISLNDCSFPDVESVLVKYVDEVAKENSFSPKDCVMLLSLCPSRGLLEAGKRVIECLGSIYEKTKVHGSQKTPLGKNPEDLYCKKCFQDHRIQRVESKSKKSEVITYQCTTCFCDESEHSKILSLSKPEKKCDIPEDYCLKHSKNAIETILQEFSIPGHVLNIRIYLGFVSQNLDEQLKDFIGRILE